MSFARRCGRSAIALFALVWGLAACSAGESAPPRPDVLFILIDTLRADHVGTYGYARDTTPTIDRIAEAGVVFEEVVSQSSWTQPSLISLFTARYAIEFAGNKPFAVLPESATTLAELFRAGGYATVAIGTNPHTHESLGVMQGFERQHLDLKAPADWVVDRAIEEVDTALSESERRPLLLYLHFMDVHMPLEPPPPYDTRFPGLDGRARQPAHGSYMIPMNRRDDAEFVRNARSHSIALYDGALRFVDDQIARLLDHMAERGLTDETLVVVTSDHGEAQWDHVELERNLGVRKTETFLGVGHGYALFPELLRVPLVMRIPGQKALRVPEQVRLLDVAPTLLAAAGIDTSGFEPVGVDLLAGRAEGELPALSQTRGEDVPQVSLKRDALQYLRLRDEEYLFDWGRPGMPEVSAAHPDVIERMGREVDALLGGIPEREPEAVFVPPELLEALAALGYAQAAEGEQGAEGEAAGGAVPDVR